jgi:hypothetical protein
MAHMVIREILFESLHALLNFQLSLYAVSIQIHQSEFWWIPRMVCAVHLLFWDRRVVMVEMDMVQVELVCRDVRLLLVALN